MISSEDVFKDADSKSMVKDGLEFYRRFLKEHGYAFRWYKLDILIEWVAKTDIAAA